MASGWFTSHVESVHVGASGVEFDQTLLQRCLIAGRVPWFYLGKLLWPVELTFIYERWVVDPGIWWQWSYPLATLALLVGCWLWWRKRGRRGPLVAVLLFGGTLFPALGFISVYPFRYSFVADHFQYHASLAIFVAAAAVGVRRVDRYGPRGHRVGVVLAMVVLGLCGGTTLTPPAPPQPTLNTPEPLDGKVRLTWSSVTPATEYLVEHRQTGRFVRRSGKRRGCT